MENYLNLPTEEYFGKAKSRGDNEIDALRFVGCDLSRDEPDLYQVKWWDYKILHHVEATRYWAHCYSQALKQFCSYAQDANRTSAIKTFEGRDALQTREATACVLARQSLDRIGCRYTWAFTWLVNRFVERGWPAFPRPNQLYSEELVLDLQDAWALECQASLQKPRAAIFREQGRAGIRRAYGAWALSEAKRKSSSPANVWMPVSSLVKEGLVDIGQVRLALGNEVALQVSKR